MATTPITPIVTQSWLQRHERMVIVALVLAAALFLGNKYLDRSAEKAQTQATVAIQQAASAAQQAASAQKSAEQAAAQAVQTAAVYQAMVDALQKQNASLAQAVTQRDAILGQAQTAVKTAPIPQVAQEWQTAIGGTNDIVQSTNGLTVDGDAARRTVEALLALPVAQADLADQKQITENVETELVESNQLVSKLDTQVTALNVEIADDKTALTKEQIAHKNDVSAVKAEARKSKWHWFLAGVVTGFMGRSAIK